MRLIHITDPHLSTLDGHRFASLSAKRRSGYLSWTRKRHLIHLRETLDLVSTAIKAEAPDQLILSGDLIQIGLESEIIQVSQWLEDLAASMPVFFVPGNHDVYAGDSWASMRRHWGPFLPTMENAANDGPAQGYPLIRDLGSIRLIGASSACVTPIFSARGSLGKPQMDRLSVQLHHARSDGCLPLLVIHHPPLSDMTGWRKALKEVQALQNLISSEPPALVCCGHLHHNIERTVGDSRIFCTASASNQYDASYRVFDIESSDQADEPGWTIRMQLKSVCGESAGKSDSFTVAAEKSWRFKL